MFKYYLNLDNTMTYQGLYEVHKKSCVIVKQYGDETASTWVDLGFFDTCQGAMEAAKKELILRGLAGDQVNGCLVCNKSCHKR